MLYETCVFSLYVILSEDPVVFDLMDAYASGTKLLAEKHGRSLGPQIQAWLERGPRSPDDAPPRPVKKLPVEQIAGTVGDLLEQAGDPHGGRTRAIEMYDVVYRTESLLSVHAGLAPFAAYIDWRSAPWSTLELPRVLDIVDDSIVIGAMMTAKVAAHVFRAFGFSASSADALYDRIDRLPTP